MDWIQIASAVEAKVLSLIHRTEARGCRVINTQTQSIANNTLVALSFDTQIWDTDGCWDVSDPTKLYAQRDGFYLAGGGWELNAGNNTVASRQVIIIRRNGTDYLGTNENHTVANKTSNISGTSGMFWMSAGDYIELVVRHDEGEAKIATAATLASQDKCLGWLTRIS